MHADVINRLGIQVPSNQQAGGFYTIENIPNLQPLAR